MSHRVAKRLVAYWAVAGPTVALTAILASGG